MKYELHKMAELFLEHFKGCSEDEEGNLQIHVDPKFKRAFYTRTQQAEQFALEMLQVSLDGMRAKLEAQENGTSEASEGKGKEKDIELFPAPPKAKRRAKKRTTGT